MRKTFAVMLVVCMMLALFCGCNKTPVQIPSPTASEKTTEATQKTEPASSEDPATEAPSTAPATEPAQTESETEAPTQPHPDTPPVDNSQTDKYPDKLTTVEVARFPRTASMFAANGMIFDTAKAEDGTNHYIPLTPNGEKLVDFPCVNADVLIPGYYEVSAYAEGINYTGLYAEDGTELIPCEAAIISVLSPSFAKNETEHARFLSVIYGTETTDNKDEAFFYATTRMFAIAPQSGDTYYKGYAKIYDLENRRFIPGLTVNNSSMSAVKPGGSIFKYEDEKGKISVYNAEGTVLYGPADSSVEVGNNFFIVDYKNIYDAAGNVIRSDASYPSIISGSGKYINESGKIMDEYGNLLFECGKDVYISTEHGGLFGGKDSSNNGGILMNSKGETVFQVSYNCYPEYKGYGMWCFFNSDGKSNYYMTNGKSAEAVEKQAYNLVNMTSDYAQVFPWNAPDKPVSMDGNYSTTPADGLFVKRIDRVDYLYEAFSGEQLVTAPNIEVSDSGYIFGCEETEIVTYKLSAE